MWTVHGCFMVVARYLLLQHLPAYAQNKWQFPDGRLLEFSAMRNDVDKIKLLEAKQI